MNDRLDSLENKTVKEISDQVQVMAKEISDHVKLVDRVLRGQEEMAISQENLLKRCLRDFHEQKATYADIVKGSCEKVASDMSKQLEDIKNREGKSAAAPPEDIRSTIGSVMDKERRKLNLVIHNLPECEPVEMESRELMDLHQFEDAIKEALKLKVRATRCFRAGKLREDRPRLLIVTLSDFETKMEILRSSSQLRSHPKWQHIYINPDLTPEEREVNRKLRQELASRRASGEENIIIRKGRIVKLNQDADRQQRVRGSTSREAEASKRPAIQNEERRGSSQQQK